MKRYEEETERYLTIPIIEGLEVSRDESLEVVTVQAIGYLKYAKNVVKNHCNATTSLSLQLDFRRFVLTNAVLTTGIVEIMLLTAN